MNLFNWQRKEWPDFKYELKGLEKYLLSCYERVDHLVPVSAEHLDFLTTNKGS